MRSWLACCASTPPGSTTSGRGSAGSPPAAATGRAEDLDDLDPAGRAALLAQATGPEVIRCAQIILGAIHRDMDRTRAGLRPIPRDVGSFTRLRDYRDASQYLILLIPCDPDDCTCGRAGKQGPGPRRRLPGRQRRRLPGPLDAVHRRAGMPSCPPGSPSSCSRASRVRSSATR